MRDSTGNNVGARLVGRNVGKLPAVASLLVVILAAGCAERDVPEDVAAPAATTSPRAATLVVRRVHPEGPLGIEGSAAFARVVRHGEVVLEEPFDLPMDSQPLKRELAPGTYRLQSYQRICDASACSEVGPEGWGPPRARCSAVVELDPGDRLTATVSATSRGCTIRTAG